MNHVMTNSFLNMLLLYSQNQIKAIYVISVSKKIYKVPFEGKKVTHIYAVLSKSCWEDIREVDVRVETKKVKSWVIRGAVIFQRLTIINFHLE